MAKGYFHFHGSLPLVSCSAVSYKNTSHATINTSLLFGGHMFMMAEATATVEVGEKEREGEGQVCSLKGRPCVSGPDPR